MTPLQQVARQALADARAEMPGHPHLVAHAIRLTRERTDTTLDADDAVLWALDHPTAADLPPNSVVAGGSSAFVKTGADDWATTSDDDMHYNDAQIDLMLQGDAATVLRVGSGA